MSYLLFLSFGGSGGSTAVVPSPVVGVDVPDHVAAACGRLLEQFKNQPNIVALVTALVGPTQPIEAALWQLLTQRSITTAVGKQLDALGYIVGQSRNGLSDADFARYIAARIATNDSDGRVEDLILVTRTVLNDAAAIIRVKPEGTATVVVRVAGTTVPYSTGTIVSVLLQAAVSAGVRLLTEASASSPATTFALDTGPGLDVGKLAYAI